MNCTITQWLLFICQLFHLAWGCFRDLLTNDEMTITMRTNWGLIQRGVQDEYSSSRDPTSHTFANASVHNLCGRVKSEMLQFTKFLAELRVKCFLHWGLWPWRCAIAIVHSSSKLHVWAFWVRLKNTQWMTSPTQLCELVDNSFGDLILVDLFVARLKS